MNLIIYGIIQNFADNVLGLGWMFYDTLLYPRLHGTLFKFFLRLKRPTGNGRYEIKLVRHGLCQDWHEETI